MIGAGPRGADLTNANLAGSILFGVKLRGADIRTATMPGAVL